MVHQELFHSLKNQISVNNWKEKHQPANNLCIISKCMEKAMSEQLNRYLITHSLLPNYLLAHRKNLYKKHIYQNSSWWTKRILLTGLGLLTTFGMVDHSNLIMVLENVWIRDMPLEWFNNYLRNRSVQLLKRNSV